MSIGHMATGPASRTEAVRIERVAQLPPYCRIEVVGEVEIVLKLGGSLRFGPGHVIHVRGANLFLEGPGEEIIPCPQSK